MVKKTQVKPNKYELARILGARAVQISEGAPLAIELTEAQLDDLSYDCIRIARLELEQGKIPLEVVHEHKMLGADEETLRTEAELVALEKEANLADVDEELEELTKEDSSDDNSDSSDD